MLISLLVVLQVGCKSSEPQVGPTEPDPPTPPPTTPWQPTAVELDARQANVETLDAGETQGAAPIEPADVLARQGDELTLYDPFGAPDLLAYDVAPIHTAAWWGDSLLVATDSGLLAWNNGLVDTELDGLVSGVSDMLALKSGLWMQTDAGLVVWRDGAVLDVTIDGTAAHHYARGTTGLAPVVWTAAGDQVVAVNFTDAGLVPYESFTMFGPVDDVAADSDGRVLALVEGWLVERVGPNDWVRLDIEEPARELRGRRGARGIWVRTDTRWLHVAGDAWSATDVPVGLDATEDAHGRLVTDGEDGVVRYSVGFPLLLLDVPTANVLTTAEIRVVPTAPDLEPSLSVTATSVGGDAVDLPVEDYVVTLDASVLAPGPWTLDATADYGDEVATAEATLVLGADFTPTWPDHIQPIYETQCTPCHEGTQGILALDTEQAWMEHLLVGSSASSPGILERVLLDNMPSDTRELSDTEKFLITEWRNSVIP